MRGRILIFALLVVFGVIGTKAQTAPVGKTVEVKIYLFDTHGGYDSKKPNFLAVERTVAVGESVLRSALEALLKGGTPEEASQSLHSPVSGIELVSVEMAGKTARLFFDRTEREPLTEFEKRLFTGSVSKTALQFSAVRAVEICLDGVIAAGSKTKPKKCG